MSAEEKIDTTTPVVVAKSTSQFPWVLALPFFGFVGYAAPYVTGLIYWQHYLRGLGIPSGLFEAESRDYVGVLIPGVCSERTAEHASK